QLLEKKIDVSGCISVKLTELALFMNSTFGIGLPQTKTDQRALFMKLKKHGAIDIRMEAVGEEDAVIVIRPEILTLVLEANPGAAQAASEAQPPRDEETAASPPEPTADSPPPRTAQVITLERHERSPTGRA